MTDTACDADADELLPLSPYYALNYHLGMLLGVDDFDTEQAYHRAKLRLHQAWLHLEGVVWGFGVHLDTKTGEAKVHPGLATDLAGRDLHLEADACLNVGQWYDLHQKEVTNKGTAANPKFDAHVVIRFKACLTRQVPALADSCRGATAGGTAYSRVFETIEILMRPGPWQARTPPYHRLRLLFGLDAPLRDEHNNIIPADQHVLDELARIQTLGPADRPAAFLAAFHRFAARDMIHLSPAHSADGSRTLLFPDRDDTCVVLAALNDITLAGVTGAWTLTGGTVDSSVRPSHVATTTIQDLLCGVMSNGAAAPDAGGPRFDPKLVAYPAGDQTITLTSNADLAPKSVTPDAFAVSCFDLTAGWQTLGITSATCDATNRVVTLTVNTALGNRLVRVIARGTGPAPLLGKNLFPLAGALADPPAPAQNGRDFVFMQQK
jgi:hypothetical protein